MRLQWTADGFQVIDDAKNTVTVTTEGWGGGGDPPPITSALAAQDTGPDEPALTVTGVAEAVEFPPVHIAVMPLGKDDQYSFTNRRETLSLDDEAHLLRVDSNVRVFVRFDGAAEFRRVGSESIQLAFAERTPVSMGFENSVGLTNETITVPETPDGVATALSAMTAANETTSPDRTWPTQRKEPPRIEFGASKHVPSAIHEQREDTDIEIVVPPELEHLLAVAPLGHYLGAVTCVAPEATPSVDIDGRVVELGSEDTFHEETAALLRRTFYLDCLTRSAGQYGDKLYTSYLIDEFELDTAALYEAPIAERVDRYLDLPYESVASEFPDWHLTMYIAPTYEYARTLPHLLANIPHVFPPESDELSKKEWLRMSTTDGYDEIRERAWPATEAGVPPNERTPRVDTEQPADTSDSTTASEERTTTESTAELEEPPTEHPRVNDDSAELRVTQQVSNVDLVQPQLRHGRSHGWLAEKVPVDVFKALPEAYENRRKYLERPGSKLSVVAIVNDTNRMSLNLTDEDRPDMRDEHDEIVEQYERRAEELNIDLTLHENVSTAHLTEIFEARNDLVHFIGHRDENGLECVNGYFSASTLRESNAQTFFLNACGSYPEGEQLIRKGSVAGGVTFESVTNDDAVKVGTAFARMMMNGFCIERALEYARGQILMPKDYAVVGDGTHVLTQNDSLVPSVAYLYDGEGESFELVSDSDAPFMKGSEKQGSFEKSEERYRLLGTNPLYTLSPSELEEYMITHDGPVIYDGELYWADEIERISR